MMSIGLDILATGISFLRMSTAIIISTIFEFFIASTAQFSNVCWCKRFNYNPFLLLNCKFLSHVCHLLHGKCVGDLRNPLWAPIYIPLTVCYHSYKCPNDKGSTSKIIYLKVGDLNERWSNRVIKGYYKCKDEITDMFRERSP